MVLNGYASAAELPPTPIDFCKGGGGRGGGWILDKAAAAALESWTGADGAASKSFGVERRSSRSKVDAPEVWKGNKGTQASYWQWSLDTYPVDGH